MIEWLKESLEKRLQSSIDKFKIADKSNDTYTMLGMKFVKAELEEILKDIINFEEREWKHKILTNQVKKEFNSYNLNKHQVDQLVSFLIRQNFSISDCKNIVQIFFNQYPDLIQKKED